MQGAFSFLKLGDLNRHEVKTTLQEYFTRQQPLFHAGCSSLLSRLWWGFFSQLLLQVLHPPSSQITAVLIALFHPCYGLLKETLA